jgi:hypothetical protein
LPRLGTAFSDVCEKKERDLFASKDSCDKAYSYLVLISLHFTFDRGEALILYTKEQLGDIFTKGLAYFSVGRCPSFRRYPKCKDCLGMKQKASIVLDWA